MVKKIPKNKLEAGDILACDIFQDNALVVPRETIVSHSNIELIKTFAPSHISIHVPDSAVAPIVSDSGMISFSNRLEENIKQDVKSIFSSESVEYAISGTVELSTEITDYLYELDDTLLLSLNRLKNVDEYTAKHSLDVAILGGFFVKTQGMSKQDIMNMCTAGLLHDIGKKDIPLHILNKPGRLTDEEFAVIKKHSLFSYNKIKNNGTLSEPIKLAVLEHHEKCDGTGYPLGLTKDKIHPYSKMLTICDIYDALVTKRPYKDGVPPSQALEIMAKMIPGIDSKLFMDFSKIVALYPNGCRVRLSDGNIGIVVKQNPNHAISPVIAIEDKEYDLSTSDIYILGEDTEENRKLWES